MNAIFDFMQDTTSKPRVILLDYVQTLVCNQSERQAVYRRGQPYENWIKQERYRGWLVDLLAGSDTSVLLVTARSEKYRTATILRMNQEIPQLKPTGYFFNELNERPPEAKQRALNESIFPVYGRPEQTSYLALESNASTRAMYKRNGIYATPVPYGEKVWTQLPEIQAV